MWYTLSPRVPQAMGSRRSREVLNVEVFRVPARAQAKRDSAVGKDDKFPELPW